MAGKKKRFLLVFLLLVGGALVGSNFWAVNSIEDAIRIAILEETEFPAVIKGFSGIVATGRFSVDYLEAKTRIDDNLAEIKSTDLTLHLDPARYLKEQYEIRNFKAESIQASYLVPEENLKLDGRFEVEAQSSKSGPVDNPPGSLWAEEVQVELETLTARIGNREWDLLQKSMLQVLPLNIVPEVGLSGRTDFDFKGQLTPSVDSNLLTAAGQFESSNSLQIEAALSALQFPTRIKWLDQWLRDEEGLTANDIISSGSLSYRIAGNLVGDLFKGQMTLRVFRPEFGKALHELAGDYPVAPLLNLLESGKEPIEIGPIEIEENMATPQIESLPYLIGGLTREFFELNSSRGSGALMEMLGGKKSSKSDGN